MGFFKRLFGLEDEAQKPSGAKFISDDRKSEEGTVQMEIARPRQKYIIRSKGQYRIFDSKEEMDAESRAKVENFEKMEKLSASYTVIDEGRKTSYSSFEDIPQEIKDAVKSSIRE